MFAGLKADLPPNYNITFIMVVLSFPNEFGYVLLAAVILAFECLLIGFLFPGRARSKIFNEDFMKSKFGSIHMSEVGG